MTSLTLLIPAYNEEKLLEKAVEYYRSYIRKLSGLESYEIIICVNGSTDNTEAVAKKLSKQYKDVKYIATRKKGMGIAMKLGIEKAEKDIMTYMPGDGEIEADFIGKAIKLMQKYDFIIGQRDKKTYKKSSLLRRIMTHGFNFVISVLLSPKVAEAASVKMFRKDWAKRVAKKSENNGFSWQIEFVYYALRDKLKIGFAQSNTLSIKKLSSSSVNPFRLAWTMLKTSLKYGIKYRLRWFSKPL